MSASDLGISVNYLVTPRGLFSKREPNLHFQPAIIRGCEEPLAVRPTGDLIRAAEQR